jgi:hypothetical protein
LRLAGDFVGNVRYNPNCWVHCWVHWKMTIRKAVLFQEDM